MSVTGFLGNAAEALLLTAVILYACWNAYTIRLYAIETCAWRLASTARVPRSFFTRLSPPPPFFSRRPRHP